MSCKYNDIIDNMIRRRVKNKFTDTYTHIAAFIPCRKCNLNKIKFGNNSNRIRYNNKKIKTHAEINALKKINLSTKKCEEYDLIVLRINKSHGLCNSAPCYHCTCEINKKAFLKIKYIYFSSDDGTITRVCFDDWQNMNKNCHHISKGWRHINSNK